LCAYQEAAITAWLQRTQHVTFDMNRAWDEAVRMLKANRELVLILAGLFFFLPVFAVGIFVPETLTGPDFTTAADRMQVMADYYNRNSGWLLLIQVVQALGMLSVLALFARRRLTVAQAIAAGAAALVPLLMAQLFLLLLALFVTARVVPLMPLLVADRRFNPFGALVDSWRMTAGKGWRILAFLILIGIAVLVVSMLLRGVIGLLTALISNVEAANLIASALSGLFSAFWLTLIMAVLMAIYRQLTASSSAAGVPRTGVDADHT
jgi:hypothetical protein